MEKIERPHIQTAPAFKNWPNDAGFIATQQHLEPVELLVKGSIPSQVAGTLYRTGPGTYKVEGSDFELSHWFDGFTHVHRFQMIAQPGGGCKVFYNSRRQNDELIEQCRREGSLKRVTFGQKRDPCATIFQKLKSVFWPGTEDKDAGKVLMGVTVHQSRALFPLNVEKTMEKQVSGGEVGVTLLTDANGQKHLDPLTLEPLGVVDQKVLHPSLKGPLSCAHPEYDPETGDAYQYNLDFGRHCTYRVFRTSAATGRTEILATLSGPHIQPAYLHSFFLTTDFVVLAIWPAIFGAGGARILWERNIIDAYSFDPQTPTRWLVVDRRHGRGLVATFVSPAFFSFHSVNAWQEDGAEAGTADLFCDIVTYPNDNVVSRSYYDNLMSSGPGVEKFYGHHEDYPSFVRYRLAGVPKTGPVVKVVSEAKMPTAEEVVRIKSAGVGELPTINPEYETKKTRFVYNVTERGLSSFFDGLARLDVETKEHKIWATDKHTPGEPIFVADGTGEGEDAGFLLSVVLNGETGTSYLLCLNARDMTEVGRAECDVAVGFGLHGLHVPPKI